MRCVDAVHVRAATSESPAEVLVVKFGALGDVVRTSYFAEAMKRDWRTPPRITWVTDPGAVDILRFNPYVDRVVAGFDALPATTFDAVFSLDDERAIVEAATRRAAGAEWHGACLDGDRVAYTASCAAWFDMGLPSRFGKEEADRLKKANTRSHGDIYAGIFAVERPRFAFHHSAWALEQARLACDPSMRIGLALFAGARWPAKSLRIEEAATLVERLAASAGARGGVRILLLGSGAEAERNREVLAALGDRARSAVELPDTSRSILDLAAVVSTTALMITADTLSMHLAIAQGIPTVSFFTVTSAAEIDTNGVLSKVVSTAPDYCSYRPRGDNGTITAASLLEAVDWEAVARRDECVAATVREGRAA